jgi:cellobiose phosphorylase
MAFCLVGELMLKRAEKAWDIFCKANPLLRSREHPEYGVEPYVYSQFVAGPETNLSGKGSHHWLTSTCSWMQYAIINWMLGVRADFDGIIVDPCIPSHWKGFQFSRPFRGSMLHVSVENPRGRNWGVKKMTVNGRVVAETKIPLPLQDEVEIRVDMG